MSYLSKSSTSFTSLTDNEMQEEVRDLQDSTTEDMVRYEVNASSYILVKCVFQICPSEGVNTCKKVNSWYNQYLS